MCQHNTVMLLFVCLSHSIDIGTCPLLQTVSTNKQDYKTALTILLK